MAEPIVNPQLPFVGEVPAGLQPGKMLRFQGVTHPNSDRFNVNLATGPNAKPRDDTALHVSVRINQGYVARNTYKDGSWGDEQGSGRLPIGPAQSFEMIILVDPNHYKIAINGNHFCEFPHRIAYEEVSHLLIDGDVSLTLISFEGIAIPGNVTATQSSQVNAEGPQGGPQFGGPQYGPPPGAYGAPPPNYGGYAPPPPPGAEPQSEFGGFFEQAQDILAGAIKSGAAEKLLGGILHSSGQPQQQPQGYAPQNARYGIYPDLPTQDTTQIPNQNTGQPNSQDSTLSNLIAGSGGTVTTGPQPVPQSSGSNALPANQQNPGPLEGLLLGILSGSGGQRGESQPTAGTGQPQDTQPGSSNVLSSILSGLLSGNNQGPQSGGQSVPQPGINQTAGSQGGGSEVLSGILQSLLSGNKGDDVGTQSHSVPGGQGPQNPQGGQGQGSDVLSGILSNLLSSNQQQQGPQGSNQPPFNPQNAASNQSQGSDVLSGILSSLLSPNQNQQGPTNPALPPQNTPQPQSQGGSEVLGNILQSLIAGSNQQQNSGPGQTPNMPPQSSTQTTNLQNSEQGGANNPEMLANLLQGLLSKAREQHDSTRPIQETNPAGGVLGPVPANPQQQYGQYPHPPQQAEQRGPVESLLSGLLSGGGHQQQQPHVPQVGGDGSIGGLGSMGGILGSLAGSLLHRPDQNQGH